jgi:hypothetical protein
VAAQHFGRARSTSRCVIAGASACDDAVVGRVGPASATPARHPSSRASADTALTPSNRRPGQARGAAARSPETNWASTHDPLPSTLSPAAWRRREPGRGKAATMEFWSPLPEFLTVFTFRIPRDASPDEAGAMTAREAVRAGELAGQGALVRLWQLPAATGKPGALVCRGPPINCGCTPFWTHCRCRAGRLCRRRPRRCIRATLPRPPRADHRH